MLNKKIFDILPPEQKEKKITKESFFSKQHRQLKTPKIRLPGFRIPSFLRSKKILIFALLILIITGFFYFFTLAKAEIKIWPEIERLIFETEIIINEKVEELDVLAKIIPGKSFEIEESISQKFSSSGKTLVERKAEGIIRVYNTFSTSTQVLVAKTRFVSADGKLFRTLNRIVVPGGRYERGKFIPGYMDVKVRANQPGEEYNIGPTTFSIPGFVGTPRFIAFYGKSYEPMVYGKSREVVYVSQGDLDEAEAILNKRIKEICFAVLKKEIAPKFDFLEEAIKIEILESFSEVESGAEIEEFNFQIRAKCRVLAFEKKNIENFALDFIIAEIIEDKALVQKSLEINYSFEKTDFKTGKVFLSLSLVGDIYSAVDQIFLQKELAGKSLTEAYLLLENLPQTNKVYIRLWPFWLNNLPKDLNKINIELKFD